MKEFLSTRPRIFVSQKRHEIFSLLFRSPDKSHYRSLDNSNDSSGSNIQNVMTPQENSADTHSSRPHHEDWPEQDGDPLDHGQDHGQHHSSGGVARGEAELVHHLDRGVLIINIVGGTAAAGEGFDDGHNNDVKQQGEQKVKEEWTRKCVKTSDGNK